MDKIVCLSKKEQIKKLHAFNLPQTKHTKHDCLLEIDRKYTHNYYLCTITHRM